MKKMIILAIAMLLIAGVAYGATVVGSKHDMRIYSSAESGGYNEVCVYCHTPHQATNAQKQDPLWNRTLSANGNYGVYASTTMNATPTNFGGGTLGTANTSQLCMSCHDGTVSVNAMLNTPSSGSWTADATTAIQASGLLDAGIASNLGTDLTDDHPVNFTYDAALATSDGGLVPYATVAADPDVRLFGASLNVQCASCHNVHDNQFGPFLRSTNVASALCLNCHVK